jgi:ABC-type multidrug transport system ATPase subunit
MELRIEHLSKTYDNGTRALNDVSLTIPSGMFGLLGPNGAGKSTLMRILATLQEADSGSVSLGDPSRGSGQVDVLRDKDAVRRTLGYLPQEFGLYPKVTAEDLLDHFAVLKGITNSSERKSIVNALLAQTNLEGARKKQLGSYSGGMRQRFGIAVALLGKPGLIIVDEPTAGLDPAERVRFLNLLAELGENAIVILSTHIVDDVSDLCSRMAIIDRGEIRLTGEPSASIGELRGKIWVRAVERSALNDYSRTHAVISTKLAGGKTLVRVFADQSPEDGFEPSPPSLEDVYFAALRGAGQGSAPAAAGVGA